MRTRGAKYSTLRKRFDPSLAAGEVLDRDFDDSFDFVTELADELNQTGSVGAHGLSDVMTDLPHGRD